MDEPQYNNFRDIVKEAPAVFEAVAGGASTILFGGMAVIEGLAAVIERDVSNLPPTGILALMAYSGYRIMKKGFNQLCAPGLTDNEMIVGDDLI